MPGRGWKYLQFAGIGFVDTYRGEFRMWKYLQFAGIEFADACPGFGSICNLLDLDLQMPGRGWKHLQLVGIGFVDAWSGLEVSTTCWI